MMISHNPIQEAKTITTKLPPHTLQKQKPWKKAIPFWEISSKLLAHIPNLFFLSFRFYLFSHHYKCKWFSGILFCFAFLFSALLCYPQMCYSDVYFFAYENRYKGLLRAYLVQTIIANTEVSRQEGSSVRGVTGDGCGGGGGGGSGSRAMKLCLCSPTHHPGSFRCRQHRTEYPWVGRLRNNPK